MTTTEERIALLEKENAVSAKLIASLKEQLRLRREISGLMHARALRFQAEAEGARAGRLARSAPTVRALVRLVRRLVDDWREQMRAEHGADYRENLGRCNCKLCKLERAVLALE